MKLLFVNDHKFYKENNDFYSSGGLPKNIWSRYLDFFSSIIVIGRKLDKKNPGLVQSNTEKVKFNLIEEYKNPLLHFNKVGLSLVIPHNKEDNFTLNFEPHSYCDNGCQIVAMNFQE